MSLTISRSNRIVTGTIELAGSKSISNRSLIIRALTKPPFEIKRLANANDTDLMQNLIQSDKIIRDAGPAGTTFRFMTAYLSMQPDTQILTGTERMKKRPIGVLVDALNVLGANIEYIEKEGYPPLKIGSPQKDFGRYNQLNIAANTSSQYISALLLIGPTLPNGIELTLTGKIVSRPYIEMTLALMAYFGVQHEWKDQTILIKPQVYQPKPFVVEADWSAASYYYAIAAIADEADIQLNGLFADSVQGDAVLVDMMPFFGIESTFNASGVHLRKVGPPKGNRFEWNFLKCPDLAQTLAVICGATGVEGHFTGLETLRIKETDRIAALQKELDKIGVVVKDAGTGEHDQLVNQTPRFGYTPSFATYEDHRMAMAFAPLALLHPIKIEEPEVVGKSYPDFWADLQKLAFEVV